jgi:hypothetical protein
MNDHELKAIQERSKKGEAHLADVSDLLLEVHMLRAELSRAVPVFARTEADEIAYLRTELGQRDENLRLAMTHVRALLTILKEAGKGQPVTRQMCTRIATQMGVDPTFFNGKDQR